MMMMMMMMMTVGKEEVSCTFHRIFFLFCDTLCTSGLADDVVSADNISLLYRRSCRWTVMGS